MQSKVTERDLEIAAWLGRHRMAMAEQVMRRFEMQRSKAYRRLSVLVEHGLVRHDRGIRSARVYLATPRGLATTGLDLPHGVVSPATAAHDLAVVDAAIPLERKRTSVVLTEREIRRDDIGTSNRFRIARAGTPNTADQRGMWPDLVTVDRVTGELHAIEVELTLKQIDRIIAKLNAYETSSYGTITYRCATAGVARAVAKARTRVGMGNRLRIERIGGDVDAEHAGDEVELLIAAVHRERDKASAAERRALDASRLLEQEQGAALALVDEIAWYLQADRSEQRAIRERWQLMTDRFAYRATGTSGTHLRQR